MEVNLVFSNHPETRKEVLHFYDYSSMEYMLPILHAGDSMLQALIEPVSLVRDRVLETLRLMASELKSDVSPNSTNPAYLTYIMDYIIFYCVCQEVFLFFAVQDSLRTTHHTYLAYLSILRLVYICSQTPVVQDVRIELLFLFPKQGCYHYTSSCI